MRIPIDVETSESRLAFELFEATTLAVGVSVLTPGNARLTFLGVKDGMVRLEIGFSTGATIGPAAEWLCARVKGRASHLCIGGASVEVDPGKVEQALNQLAGRQTHPG